MSHYNLRSWNKAIDALSLVGTNEDADSDEWDGLNWGSVFTPRSQIYIPVLRKIGEDIKARVTVSSGDSEILTGVPIAGKKNEARDVGTY